MTALSSSLARTLDAARTAWLNGDRSAWGPYAACCLRLEAELRRNAHDGPRAAAPRPPHRSSDRSS